MLDTIPMPRGKRHIKIFYEYGQDGGGSTFGVDYDKIIATKYPERVFKRCYEWCSGPGFIGYYLLDRGVCKSICLSDMYAPSINSANITANYESNQCRDQVTTYLFNDLSLLPAEEKFDLVVSNPPHFASASELDYVTEDQLRCAVDQDWQAHQNFFKHIGDHLLPGGIILLQENMFGSTADTFAPYIKEAGLTITDCIKSDDWWYPPESDLKLQIYYIEIQKK